MEETEVMAAAAELTRPIVQRGKFKTYPGEFKQKVVALVRDGVAAGTLARHLGISGTLIRNWVKGPKARRPGG